MKKYTAAPLCEGAIAAALTVLLLTAGMYLPALGMFATLVAGIPLLWLTVRRGLYISGAALVASLALMFALTGDFVSGPLGCFLVLLPYIAAGFCIGKDYQYYTTLCVVTVAVLIGLVADIMLMNAMMGGNVVIDTIDQSVGTMRTVMNEYLSAGGEELTGSIFETLDLVKETILGYFPSIMIIASLMGGYVILSLGIFFAARLRVKRYAYVPFYMIRVPKSLCVITVVLMIVTLFSDRSSMFTLAINNATAVLSFMLAVGGMSFLDFKLKNKIRSGYKRFAVYMLVLIVGYIFISIIFYALMFTGMLDSNLNLRMSRRAGD